MPSLLHRRPAPTEPQAPESDRVAAAPAETPEPPSVEEVIEQSAGWLLRQQDAATGGWGERHGKRSSVLNTAESVIALLDSRAVEPGDRRIRRALEYLGREQVADGPDRGAWRRVLEHPGAAAPADIVRTAFAVEALVKGGTTPTDEPAAAAVEWLLRAERQPDGGWAYGAGASVGVTPTCFVLGALLAAHRAGDERCRGPIERGLALLTGRFRNDECSFGERGPLEAVQTIYAVLVLQEARRQHIGSYLEEERSALRWLRHYATDPLRLVEERVAIDPDGHADYDFLFMANTLVLRALMGSVDEADRESQLARSALLNLHHKIHASGGVYGDRVFTWSTAKAISALVTARAEFAEMPSAAPEPPPAEAPALRRHLLFGFALVIAGLVTALLVLGRFTATAGIVFAFLTLAVLVGYGLISEKGFVEFGGLLRFWKAS